MPQLGLQQTVPTLQVERPQDSLKGMIGGLSQMRVSHGAPGLVQMPQLALQQTSFTLQVFCPQETLIGAGDMPHTNWLHFSPGGVQMPQLGLQHV